MKQVDVGEHYTLSHQCAFYKPADSIDWGNAAVDLQPGERVLVLGISQHREFVGRKDVYNVYRILSKCGLGMIYEWPQYPVFKEQM